MSNTENWFIWGCFIDQKKLPSDFIYGYAAQTHRKPVSSLSKTERLIDGRKVYFFQQIVSPQNFGDIFTLEALDFAGRTTTFYFQKNIIQQRLGHYAPASLLCSTKVPEELSQRLGTSDEFIAKLLTTLEAETGISFTEEKNYARLGCFEYISNHDWLDNSPPFQINIKENHKPEIEALEVRRTSSFSSTPHLLHLILRNKGSVVRDKIYSIPKNRSIFPLPDDIIAFSQIETWLFSKDGNTVLHYENHHLLQEIGIRGGIVTGSKIIQDKLSERASGKNKLLGKKAELVTTSALGSYSTVTSLSQNNWPDTTLLIKNRVKRFFVNPKVDRWFSKGIENEIEVIEYIRSLIDSRKAKRAILVDPFFGYDALQRFVLRIESSDTNLTILTSLGNESPDSHSQTIDDPNDLIKRTLHDLSDIMINELKVLNIRTSKNTQAFHDRYLCTYDSEGNSKVFLLSNSINKASGNWPFCMSLLADDVAYRAKNYIEALCDAKDIESNQDLEVTYKWPED